MAIDEEGGTSDEAEDSEMESQMDDLDQSSQASHVEVSTDIDSLTFSTILNLQDIECDPATLHHQTIIYRNDNGEVIADTDSLDNPFVANDRSSPTAESESLGEEDMESEEETDLESDSDAPSFHTVPLDNRSEKENTPPKPIEAVTPNSYSTPAYQLHFPPYSYLETNVYTRAGPITLVLYFPGPGLPPDCTLHSLRGHHTIPLMTSYPHLIVPNPMFTWINSLNKFLAQFPDKFVKSEMIKLQYIVN
ncbi:hypothetical protein Moror_1325 [Moniliophthora roreri MCA 2997]|nr:hypothetical protein Moror_1325 [Moniliophthora roreri MCA 2997]